jgi:hypothetical protein
VLTPVLASLAILGGSAQEPVCHGQLSPAAKEQARIDGYFALRYGPVTTEVIATEPTSLECAEAGRYRISSTGRGLLLRWQSRDIETFERVDVVEHADRVEVGIVERVRNDAMPYEYTSAERRYLYLLDEFFFDSRVEQYIDRHRDEYGGGEYLKRFPGGPFKLEYFTRRVGFHRANLRRLTRFPRRLRVRRSEHAIAEIEAIGSQVQEEAAAGVGFVDGWGDAGFYVRGSFPLPDRLLVYVVTPRDDHAADFRERYGAAIGTLLVGMRYECEQ